MIRTLFLEPLAILVLAGLVLVGAPWLTYRDMPPEPGLEPYSEAELRGREAYVAHACSTCHSQQPRDPAFGPDAARGWGRASVAGDYVYDAPHQLGTMRTGPDLFNVGARLPSEDWHLTHLYQPRALVPWSVMAPYPFLFQVKPAPEEGDRVVAVPPPWGPEEGVVVAKPEALDLVAYLMALDHTQPSAHAPLRTRGTR